MLPRGLRQIDFGLTLFFAVLAQILSKGMETLKHAVKFFVIFTLLGQSATHATEGGSFRWQDDQGVWHFSDQVPPSEAHRPRERVDQRGVSVEKVAATKTAEQRAQELELKRLRRDSNRVLAEQQDHDQALLRSYRSVDEIQHALEGKTHTIDGLMKVTELNNHRFRDTLAAQEKRAAELERDGQTVPKNLIDSIETTKRQVAANNEKLRELAVSKEVLKDNFNADIERFEVLKSREGTPLSVKAALANDQPPGELVAPSYSICNSEKVCGLAWQRAQAYVEASDTTPLDVITPRLLKGQNPVEETDIALTVTRIVGSGQSTLFLDIHCKDNGIGREICASERTRALRNGFRSYVEGQAPGISSQSE